MVWSLSKRASANVSDALRNENNPLSILKPFLYCTCKALSDLLISPTIIKHNYIFILFVSSYYTLMMWFPDLFERFSQFTAYYGDVPAGVCEVSANLTQRATMSLLNESIFSTAPASLEVVMQTKKHPYLYYYLMICIILSHR